MEMDDEPTFTSEKIGNDAVKENFDFDGDDKEFDI